METVGGLGLYASRPSGSVYDDDEFDVVDRYSGPIDNCLRPTLIPIKSDMQSFRLDSLPVGRPDEGALRALQRRVLILIFNRTNS